MEKYAWAWKSGPMTLGQASAVQNDDLRFCGCGSPEDALRFIYDVLGCYEKNDNDIFVFNRERAAGLLPNDGVFYFVMYQLDHAGLTEHGGSVPGWLTEKGVRFRDALESFGVDEVADAVLDYLTGEAE